MMNGVPQLTSIHQHSEKWSDAVEHSPPSALEDKDINILRLWEQELGAIIDLRGNYFMALDPHLHVNGRS